MNTFKQVFPPTLKRYERYLRLNGEILSPQTTCIGKEVGEGFYGNGLVVKRLDPNTINIQSTTVENGQVSTNFYAEVDNKGNVKSGAVNCFALGMMKIDQGYLDEYVEEIYEQLEEGIEYFDVKEVC